MEERNIVNYFELPEKWQVVARKNLDAAEDVSFLKPLKEHIPGIDVLLDLGEAMIMEGNDGYNAIISLSNNSAMQLKIDDCYETAIIKYI